MAQGQRSEQYKMEQRARMREYHRHLPKERLMAYRARLKAYKQERKLAAIAYFSDGKNCCACCGITQMEFLTIDHINGNGTKERKAGFSYRKMQFPPRDKFQVLCFNCNWGKHKNKGVCPHQKIKEEEMQKALGSSVESPPTSAKTD